MKMIDISRSYDKIADRITMPDFFYNKAVELCFELGKIGDKTIILDIGCGQGFLLEKIARRCHQGVITGLDFSKELLKRSHSRLRGCAQFILGDILNMPFRDESLSIIFCAEVIEHVENPHKLLNEVYRSLKPRGMFILTVPNVLAYYPFYFFLKKLPLKVRSLPFLNFFVPSDDPTKSFQPIDNTYSSTQVTKWLIQHQFIIRAMEGTLHLMPFTSFPRLRKLLSTITSHFSSIFAYDFYLVVSK